SERGSFAQRQLDDLLRTPGERDVFGRRGLSASDGLLDLHTDRRQRDVERLECSRTDPFALGDEAEQEMLGPDVVVVEEPCFSLGQHDDPTRAIREPLEHSPQFSPWSRVKPSSPSNSCNFSMCIHRCRREIRVSSWCTSSSGRSPGSSLMMNRHRKRSPVSVRAPVCGTTFVPGEEIMLRPVRLSGSMPLMESLTETADSGSW